MIRRLVDPYRRIITILPLAVAVLLAQGCSPDVGPPPDETAKNHPVSLPMPPGAAKRRGGEAPKLKSIKDRT